MNPIYKLADESQVLSPSMIFYPELIRKNIAYLVEAAGGPERVRPHVKTHKTREIVKMQLEVGITKHKCATIAEAEMLATCNAPDVLIAYPLVGPNLGRLVALMKKYPETRFSSLIDDPNAAKALAAAMAEAGLTLDFLIDLNVGQNRTGIAVNDALPLYEAAAHMKGLRPSGFHAYDAHNNQESLKDRETTTKAGFSTVLDLRVKAEAKRLPVPRLVCGGTPGFSVYSKIRDVPGLECSPGTFVLSDAGYGSKYPDLNGFTPAAVLITRVVSKPTPNRVTLDLGNKSVAADPVLTSRVTLLDFPAFTTVGHNEEHLIVETAGADRYKPGDVVYALPGHICPSVALHREVLVAEKGKIVGKWTVASRDRVLTV